MTTHYWHQPRKGWTYYSTVEKAPAGKPWERRLYAVTDDGRRLTLAGTQYDGESFLDAFRGAAAQPVDAIPPLLQPCHGAELELTARAFYLALVRFWAYQDGPCLVVISSGPPATARAMRDVVGAFESRQDVIKWAASQPFSLTWRP